MILIHSIRPGVEGGVELFGHPVYYWISEFVGRKSNTLRIENTSKFKRRTSPKTEVYEPIVEK